MPIMQKHFDKIHLSIRPFLFPTVTLSSLSLSSSLHLSPRSFPLFLSTSPLSLPPLSLFPPISPLSRPPSLSLSLTPALSPPLSILFPPSSLSLSDSPLSLSSLSIYLLHTLFPPSIFYHTYPLALFSISIG